MELGEADVGREHGASLRCRCQAAVTRATRSRSGSIQSGSTMWETGVESRSTSAPAAVSVPPRP